MHLVKKSKLRYEWGALDVISAIILLIGVYIYHTYPNYQLFSLLIMVLAILKQFSGK